MAKYVPDVKTQRWVIISPARTKRPDEATAPKSGAVVCAFCQGNESFTPPEVYRIGGGEKDKPGWQVRVVPNKYAITDIHEVIIHTPNHTDDLEHLPVSQVTRILTAYRDRFRAHENDGQVIIFCNHGFHAGASLIHPHSQLVVVPKQINLDSLYREPIANVVEENTSFMTYCPDFSQWPYETWIAPKTQGTKFGDTPEGELPDLAKVLQTILIKLEKIYLASTIKPKDRSDSAFVYNYYIYHGTDWFIRIIPRFIHRAGFELGTGLNVNVVDPTDAATEIKETAI
jgi:UDPglucose--hexose-1-phosphate uridylyltransferase